MISTSLSLSKLPILFGSTTPLRFQGRSDAGSEASEQPNNDRFEHLEPATNSVPGESPSQGSLGDSRSGETEHTAHILPAVEFAAPDGDYVSANPYEREYDEETDDFSLERFMLLQGIINRELVQKGIYISEVDLEGLLAETSNIVDIVNRSLKKPMDAEEELAAMTHLIADQRSALDIEFFEMVFHDTIEDYLEELSEEEAEQFYEANSQILEECTSDESLAEFKQSYDEFVDMEINFLGKYPTIQQRTEKVRAIATEFLNSIPKPE